MWYPAISYPEMSLLCTRIGIMRSGRLVADSSAQALQRSQYGKIRLRVGQPGEAVQILESQFTDIAVEVQEDVLLVGGDALDSGQLNRMLVLNDVDVYGWENKRRRWRMRYGTDRGGGMA
ncbi:MAG: hypothetical protein ACLR23_02620 [Clostridia bacterium]